MQLCQGAMHSMPLMHHVRPVRTRRRADRVFLPASRGVLHGAKHWTQPVGSGQDACACCLPGIGSTVGLGAAQVGSSSNSSREANGDSSVMMLSQEARDIHFMRAALDQADRGSALGEVPVGAVLVSGNGEVLSAAHNLTHTSCNPVAHAEMRCIMDAASRRQAWRLLDATLYVTLEPCPMCAGAILQSRIASLVYGAPQPRLGADGSWVSLFPASAAANPFSSSSSSTSTSPAPAPSSHQGYHHQQQQQQQQQQPNRRAPSSPSMAFPQQTSCRPTFFAQVRGSAGASGVTGGRSEAKCKIGGSDKSEWSDVLGSEGEHVDGPVGCYDSDVETTEMAWQTSNQGVSSEQGVGGAWQQKSAIGMHSKRPAHRVAERDESGVLDLCEAAVRDSIQIRAANATLLTEAAKQVQPDLSAQTISSMDVGGMQAAHQPIKVQGSCNNEGVQRASAVADAATAAAAPPPHPFHNQIQVRRGVLKEECAQIMRDFFKARRIQNAKEKAGRIQNEEGIQASLVQSRRIQN